MNEANNQFDIFNLSIDTIDTHKEEKKQVSELWAPKADDGKDGVYTALIRFLPNPKNPSKSILRKYVYWLEDGEGKGSYYDSPSTVGEKCPVQDLFFKLRNSESAIEKTMAEKLKRRNVFYSLIQIVKDSQNPADEGKIMVFKYGWQIKKKIDDELNPEFEEPTQVFDLFNGKNFEVKITKQAGFNNYDSSKFHGKIAPIMIGGELMSRENAEHRSKITEYLKGCPDLGIWDYKPWDDEARRNIEKILDQYRSPGKRIKTVTSANDDVVDALVNAEIPRQTSKPVESVQETHEETTDTGDLNSFLDGLDI